MAVKETRSIFPNFSSQATEEEKNLSLQEKLNLIDDEIRQLYEFCSNAGYTHLQIEQCARPLLDVQNREKHIKWFRGLCYLGLVVLIIVLLFVCDPAYRQVCIYGKFVAMKVSSRVMCWSREKFTHPRHRKKMTKPNITRVLKHFMNRPVAQSLGFSELVITEA